MASNLKIFHNPRCSKSRQALAILQEKKLEPQIIEYLKVGIDKKEMEQIIINSSLAPDTFIRKKEKEFEDFCTTEKFTAKSVAQILHDCPKLLERPLLLIDKKVIIARPPELINTML
ncbi:MAG: hypothetical protein KC505_00390 [Myxococcales bacterium]|nr:hypothetical protein [Myxococcales bacterium]USN51799.1 MAG: arsenate reductase (glutaredoxin) [Myxococcales bacterium]